MFRTAIRLTSVLTGALLCTGCFQLSSVLTVRGDGSGTITQRLIFTEAALSQLRGFATLGGRGFDPMSEQQARDAAAALGPGVTYVSSAPVTTPDGEGRDVTYTFADINQLRLSQAPPAPGGVRVRGLGLSAEAVSFQLTREPDGRAVLRVNLPRPSMPIPDLRSDPTAGQTFSPDQLAMFRQMIAGARLAVAIEPDGRLLSTSSAFVDGNRVTLVDVDFNALLTNDGLIARLQDAKTEEAARQALSAVPGLKMNVSPQVVIEFTPR